MNKKRIILPLIITLSAVVLIVGVSLVSAYMFKKSETTVNNFDPAVVSCAVEEVFDGQKKTSIKVKNTGNVKAYLRLKIVTYWQDSKGNAVWISGQDSDTNNPPQLNSIPNVNVDLGTDWKSDNEDHATYYYTKPVEPNGLTENLLNSEISGLNSVQTTVNGVVYTYYPVVEIVAEAIQSDPTSAVTESWKVTIDSNGTITAIN